LAINWDKLRTWNGSVATAFEELCCQLAASESAPAGARFFRKGTPDAGVECFWQLTNAHEWAWQAKWFRSSPSGTQWKEIDDSVEQALGKHPHLTKYTICLPIDRSDARIGNQKSFLAKWQERVAKWERLAGEKGMAVTFDYWGESEIGRRLSEEQHRGRHWFWFNEERFSDTWFISRVDEAVENARERYTPTLNVDLPIRRNFDSLGRTPAFFERVAKMYSDARIKLRTLRPPSQPRSLKERYEHIQRIAPEVLSRLEPWVTGQADYVEWSATRPIPWDDIGSKASDVAEAAMDALSELYELREKRKKEKADDRESGSDDLGYRIYGLREFQGAVNEIAYYSRSPECRLSNLPALLLVGEAGQGKTHLLCHVAKTDALESRARVILHGEQFKNDEPWSQIVRLLGLNCSRDEFIGALEAAAQASNARVLLFIDALNEGEGNRLWWKFLPGMLTALTQSPWLGICISVRDSYEDLVVPKTLDDTRRIRVRHEGFSELAYDAAAKFFHCFGIEPSTPLLLPEFNNPLFLKLFCQSLYNAKLSRVPAGLRGLTAVFRFYIESIDKKLSRPEWLDYDERTPIVPRAVERVADEMAKRKIDYLPLEEAQTIVDAVLPRQGHEKSLFHHLESEGVLTVVPDYWNRSGDTWAESARFTYQRFSDHRIAQRLLERHLDKSNPTASFSKRRTLGKLLKDEQGCRRNRGLLEAFTIQLPELTKKELPEVAPHLAEMHAMREGFVEGIVWRDLASFGPEADRYINEQVLRYRGTFEDFWNALLTLATTPDHPFNADRLHAVLSRFDMADRDAWWSTYVHHEWGNKRAVDRLVEWAWEENDKSIFDDEVIRLAGIALAWFFTTANRFLRDRATQAFVRLCENRLTVLRQIIEKFGDVDDPYVTERLFAAAYGCAMRTTDEDGLAHLATDVFRWVFDSGAPPPHVLMRDYARGVIEVALHRGASLKIDTSKIKPPYKSEWPGLVIPDSDKVEQLGKWEEDMSDEQCAMVHLHHSVTGDGDFSRYVIGDLDRWSSERIGEPAKPTRKQVHDQFVESLTARQKEAWDTYCALRRSVDDCRVLQPERRKEMFEREFTQAELDAALVEAERILNSRLRRGSKKHRLFQDVVKDYVDQPHQFYRENAFDGELARRWMIQRILDLGWTVERFGRFDRSISSQGRDARKPERIGKKYQWIAYHELLARLSDNFKLREDEWSGRGPAYDEPEDAGVSRDIDPSNLLRRTHRDEWTTYTNTWWFPTEFDSWDDPDDEVGWLKECRDLPNAEQLIQVCNPDDNTEWLTLHGYYHWEQPTPVGEDRHEFKRRDLWYMLKCYLVEKKDSARLLRWARKQSWMGRWMPESHESYGIFLGEFFWARAFKTQDCSYYHRDGWTRGDNDRIPAELLVADDEYARESGGFDCSLDDSVFIALPCRFLADSMRLAWRGREGCWFNEAGELVAFDPSVRHQGPHVLLAKRDALLSFLNEQNLTLFWTLLGEKRTIGGPMWGSRDYKGRLEVNGAYVLKAAVLSGATRSEFHPPGES
jgi:hypothetical protein